MKRNVFIRFILIPVLFLVPQALMAREIENIRPEVVGDRIINSFI